MVREDKLDQKSSYLSKLGELFTEYPKVYTVDADNVGSKQMQQIRTDLRGHAVMVMGKNTMMRRGVRCHTKENLEQLMPHLRGIKGLIFTKEEFADISAILSKHTSKVIARQGKIAQTDINVRAQNTGLGPEKTSFFQALDIPTKITKGTIEIKNDVKLVKAGDKIGMSESILLKMLNMTIEYYGLVVKKVYDGGTVYDPPKPVNITPKKLISSVIEGIKNCRALSMEMGSTLTPKTTPIENNEDAKEEMSSSKLKCAYAALILADNDVAITGEKIQTILKAASVKVEPYWPGLIAEALKKCNVHEIIGNIGSGVGAAPFTVGEDAQDAGGAPPVEPNDGNKEEPEEESDDDMGFNLFE